MVDEADAPRQSGVDRARGARRPAQARERVVPVAAQLVGLTQQALEPRIALRGGHRVARLHDRLDGPLAQQRRSVLAQQPRGGAVVADRAQRPQRQRRLGVCRVPAGGAGVQLVQVVVGQRQRGQCDVAHQARRREPAFGVALGEQPAARQRAERVGCSLDPQRGAEAGMDTLEWRGNANQLARLRCLLREHLARQVAEERPAGPAQALDRRVALRRLQRAHRLAREAHGGRPALGDRVQRVAELARVAVELGCEHRAYLVGVEGEVGAAELEDLALTAQAVDREGRLDPRGEHDVQGRGRLAAERLDRAHRRPVGRQRVEVVEDERERPAQALLQRLRQRSGEGVRARALVGTGVGTARGGGRRRQIDGQVGHAQPQRVDEAAGERGERRVLRPERVPGDVVTVGPGRQERRLAEAGPRDHGAQAALQGIVQAPLQRGARERRGRDRCGQDLRPQRHRASCIQSGRRNRRRRGLLRGAPALLLR